MNKYFYGIFLICFTALFVSCEPEVPPLSPPTPPPPSPVTYENNQAVSKKRGIGFNAIYAADFPVLADGVSWAYNWGNSGFNPAFTEDAKDAKIEYFPMCWNGVNANALRSFKQANPDCEYILAYNEPNLTDQANMTPAQAAAKWGELKSIAQELNLKIVAPAMNYGTLAGYSDPIVWYDEFFSQPEVSIDDVAALALHCYMPNAAGLKGMVERFRKYNKPIWMTEFCYDLGMNPNADQQRQMMCDVLNYFETDPLIERYAWFMFDAPAKWGSCGLRPVGNNKGQFTDLGKIYVNFSSMDKEYHYGNNQVIPAEHYSNNNMADDIGTTTYKQSVRLSVCSDTTGILEVNEFRSPKWLEYQIAQDSLAGNYKFVIRYASGVDSKMKIMANGKEIGEVDLPKTGGYTTWATIETPALELGEGKQTIRFAPSEGIINMNWWRYKKES
ncbi:MAG: DUF5010 C-terminal domain-containing protein [Bacteroidales bacterium]|jgi:hypothetical protein|nr:DUF5010 C-terminal domain-containing protein [Bacteroidales bacterium]